MTKSSSLICLTIVALILTGCDEETADSTIVLRVANWSGAQVEDEFARLERVFREEFEAAHPGVKIQMEQIPGYGQYAPKLLMMHVAGSIPDVIQLDVGSAAVFIDNGVLSDLRPFIEADPDFRLEDYFENVLETCKRGDALYGIPLDFTPMVMYYNKTLFDAVGEPYPREGWTWDDFLETAKALTMLLAVPLTEPGDNQAALDVVLDAGSIPDRLSEAFRDYGMPLSNHARIATKASGKSWMLSDHGLNFELLRVAVGGEEKIFVHYAGGGYPTADPAFQALAEETPDIETDHVWRTRAPIRFGMFFENEMPFWVLWLWTNGGDVLSPDGRRATGYFDGPKSIEAVQFIEDLIARHGVTPHPRDSAAAGLDMFRNSQTAMELKGHWKLIDYRAEGLDIGVVGLPTNGVPRTTVVYASGMSVTAKARHPQLAWEFVKHITSAGVQERRVASGLAISGNKTAAAKFAGTPIEDAFLNEIQYARRPWGATVEAYPFLETLGREMMEDILYSDGELPVEQAMKETAKLMDAALGEK